MTTGVQKMRDFYAIKPGAHMYMKEFGYYVLERWQREGHLPKEDAAAYKELGRLCGFDEPGIHPLGQLGWCEAALCPVFPELILQDRGSYELIQDYAGRGVLVFKGRRNGFMPEYETHPVNNLRDFEEKIQWRLAVDAPGRFDTLEARMAVALADAKAGLIIQQNLIGGYMYLRSLIGPVGLLYAFHDQPELIHAAMKAWLDLADNVISRHQAYLPIDELFMAEDICYNHGILISPEMMRRFLFPYYQQLIDNTHRRQKQSFHIQIDTDGFSDPALPVYRELGVDIMSPFEAASNCDVLRTAQAYPDLRISGGMDKMVLARGRDAIDRMVDHILPPMHKRGGYLPTCDHGVPEEVAFEDYIHFRKRLLEFT